MKIKVIPIAVTAVLSAALLIGGWYIFRNVTAIQPLEQIVKAVPGVTAAKPVIGNSSVTVDVSLNNTANIRTVYDSIAREGHSVIGSKKLRLTIQEQEKSPELDDVWSTILFDIAQAMETRKYAEIPIAMKKLEANHPGITAVSEMDDTNVYITLRNKETVKHIVLPRTPDQMGVWPDA